jgi:hypothetical protein
MIGGMAKTKLNPHQIEQLREAYESWNPHDSNSETAEQLAARFGISKQTMYTLRRNWLAAEREGRVEADIVREDQLHEAIVFLTQELAAARARIRELEAGVY